LKENQPYNNKESGIMPYIITDACILCGACVVGCESNAITEGETQSHIDVTICVECGTCERNCPSEAIIFVEESETEAGRPSTTAEQASTS
jgi:ferredoxin